jgi:hypothetical protein
MKSSSVFSTAAAALTAVTLLTGCDGLKEAMTAHVDTVARAGTQELSVDRLASLLSEIDAPPDKDLARAVANAWIDYQLLGQSAATGDTIFEAKEIEAAMWAPIAGMKARKYYEMISKDWGSVDTAASRQAFERGDVLAAAHILFMTQGKSDAEKEAARKKAESVRAQVTSANFAEMASKYSEEPGAAGRAGALGVFPKGVMVPEFEQAVVALKPGEVSPVIETQFGYHIVRRSTFDEVKNDQSMAQTMGRRSMQVAESTFVANLQKNGKLEVKSGNAGTIRAVLNDPQSHLEDGTTLATSAAGKFTAGRLAQWLQAMPPQQVMQQRMFLQDAPDSVVEGLVKNFVTNELVMRAADSAKIAPSAEDLDAARRNYIYEPRSNAWMQLGVDPRRLSDSAKTVSERERLAAARVDKYIENLAAGKAAFAQVPPPLANALRSKSKVSINAAGLERAVEKATQLKATQDSVRRATQPSSIIPMPGESTPEGAQDSEGQSNPQQ